MEDDIQVEKVSSTNKSENTTPSTAIQVGEGLTETDLPEGLKKIRKNLTGASLKYYNKLKNNEDRKEYLEALKDEKKKDRKKGV